VAVQGGLAAAASALVLVEALEAVQVVLERTDLCGRPGARLQRWQRQVCHLGARVAVQQRRRVTGNHPRGEAGQVARWAFTVARASPSPWARESLVTVGVGEVVAEPGQVQGDLPGDLYRADPADRSVEISARPLPDRVRGPRGPIGAGTTFREGNLRRSGRNRGQVLGVSRGGSPLMAGALLPIRVWEIVSPRGADVLGGQM
jgi:hypothetical protein